MGMSYYKLNLESSEEAAGRKPDITDSRRTLPDDFLFIDLKRQWSIVNLI